MEFQFNLPAAVVFYLGPVPVTSTIIAAWLAIAVLILLTVLVNRRQELVPGGLQNFVEFAIESLLGPCEQFAGPRGRSFLPFSRTNPTSALRSRYPSSSASGSGRIDGKSL